MSKYATFLRRVTEAQGFCLQAVYSHSEIKKLRHSGRTMSSFQILSPQATLRKQYKGNFLKADSQLPAGVPAQTAEFRFKVKCKNMWSMTPTRKQRRQNSQSSGFAQLAVCFPLCIHADTTLLPFLWTFFITQILLQATDLAKPRGDNFSVGFREAESFQSILKKTYKESDVTQNSWFGTKLPKPPKEDCKILVVSR